MTPEEKNDLHYVCSLVEFLSRKLHVRHRDLANAITPTVFTGGWRYAAVNHCLSFDEVADTAIAQLHLQNGDYDVSTGCRYKIPSVEDIGALYQQLIQAVQKKYKGKKDQTSMTKQQMEMLAEALVQENA